MLPSLRSVWRHASGERNGGNLSSDPGACSSYKEERQHSFEWTNPPNYLALYASNTAGQAQPRSPADRSHLPRVGAWSPGATARPLATIAPSHPGPLASPPLP